MSIVVVGSVGLDTITTPGGVRHECMGGSAAHFSLSASFYSKVHLVAVVGTDFPGEFTEVLRRRSVDVAGLQVRPGKTFRWAGYYTVDFHRAHTLDTQLNVFQDFAPELPGDSRGAPFVFLANIDPDLQMKVLDQVESPRLVVADTMNFWIETKRQRVLDVLKRIDLLIINDGEARDLCETHDMIDAGRKLLGMGPKMAIIKKGEHGAALFKGDKIFVAPAFPYARMVDPTGAGDSFAGGVVGHLARTGDLSDDNIRRAVIYGSIMGSFNIEDFSVGRISRLESEHIEERFNIFRDLVRF